ncbi:unnamed protein product [marine sediment metagenome]|uniref:Uncharacterized protein n=1 Tax=marine sediment metagenome TaxID=412755 RepID=X0XEM0_9ZZZZ
MCLGSGLKRNKTVTTLVEQRVYRLPFSPVACDGGVPHAARLNAVFFVTRARLASRKACSAIHDFAL